MTNRNKLLTYFQKFSDKDLEALAEMFAEDVRLTDWDIAESGKMMSLPQTKESSILWNLSS